MNSWEKIFFKNISTYLNFINNSIAIKYKPVPLKEHIKLLGGYAFKSTEHKKQGIPIIRISDFQNEKIVISNVVFYKEDRQLDKYALKAGDIIIALTGGTIGKLAIVQDGLGKIYLNQRVAKFDILNKSEFISEYVYWLARGVEGKIRSLAWGGAQPNVSPKQIEEMLFPIPPIELQKSVIIFLNDLRNNKLSNKHYFQNSIEQKIVALHKKSMYAHSLINENQNQSSYLTQLRQAILQEAIEGKLTAQWRKKNHDTEPASVLLEKIKAEKAQLLKEKKIKKQKALPPISDAEKPFELPDGWGWIRLDDCCTFINGKAHEQLIDSEGKFILINSKYISMNGAVIKRTNQCNCPLEVNDVVIVMSDVPNGRALARCFLVDAKDTYTLNQRIGALRPIEIHPPYFKIMLERNNHFLNFDDGKKQTNLRKGQILSCPLGIPSFQEQKAIVTKVEKLLALCDQLETRITKNQAHADQLMQAVLKEAFDPDGQEPGKKQPLQSKEV